MEYDSASAFDKMDETRFDPYCDVVPQGNWEGSWEHLQEISSLVRSVNARLLALTEGDPYQIGLRVVDDSETVAAQREKFWSGIEQAMAEGEVESLPVVFLQYGGVRPYLEARQKSRLCTELVDGGSTTLGTTLGATAFTRMRGLPSGLFEKNTPHILAEDVLDSLTTVLRYTSTILLERIEKGNLSGDDDAVATHWPILVEEFELPLDLQPQGIEERLAAIEQSRKSQDFSQKRYAELVARLAIITRTNVIAIYDKSILVEAYEKVTAGDAPSDVYHRRQTALNQATTPIGADTWLMGAGVMDTAVEGKTLRKTLLARGQKVLSEEDYAALELVLDRLPFDTLKFSFGRTLSTDSAQTDPLIGFSAVRGKVFLEELLPDSMIAALMPAVRIRKIVDEVA